MNVLKVLQDKIIFYFLYTQYRDRVSCHRTRNYTFQFGAYMWSVLVAEKKLEVFHH